MARRLDHDRLAKQERAIASTRPEWGARKDSKVIAARSRPTVEQMLADVAAARHAATERARSPLDDLDE